MYPIAKGHFPWRYLLCLSLSRLKWHDAPCIPLLLTATTQLLSSAILENIYIIYRKEANTDLSEIMTFNLVRVLPQVPWAAWVKPPAGRWWYGIVVVILGITSCYVAIMMLLGCEDFDPNWNRTVQYWFVFITLARKGKRFWVWRE